MNSASSETVRVGPNRLEVLPERDVEGLHVAELVHGHASRTGQQSASSRLNKIFGCGRFVVKNSSTRCVAFGIGTKSPLMVVVLFVRWWLGVSRLGRPPEQLVRQSDLGAGAPGDAYLPLAMVACEPKVTRRSRSASRVNCRSVFRTYNVMLSGLH